MKTKTEEKLREKFEEVFQNAVSEYLQKLIQDAKGLSIITRNLPYE